jgi:hypothetical protein
VSGVLVTQLRAAVPARPRARLLAAQPLTVAPLPLPPLAPHAPAGVTFSGPFVGNVARDLGASNLNTLSGGGYVAAMFLDPGNLDVLYQSANGNRPAGAVYTLPLTRDPATRAVTAITPYSASNPATARFLATPKIDGGLLMYFDGAGYAPSNLRTALWTTYSDNEIRQVMANGTTITTRLAPLGPAALVGGSTGGMMFAQGASGPIPNKLVTTDYSKGTVNLWTYAVDGAGVYSFTFVRGYEIDVDPSAATDLYYSTALMVRGASAALARAARHEAVGVKGRAPRPSRPPASRGRGLVVHPPARGGGRRLRQPAPPHPAPPAPPSRAVRAGRHRARL